MRRLSPRAFILGVLVAWALLVMLAFTKADMLRWRVVLAEGATGGVLALLAAFFRPRQPAELTRKKAFAWGCWYAALGFMFWTAVLIVAVLMTNAPLQLTGCMPATLLLVAFGGLGLFSGMTYHRFRVNEADQQRAAIAEQELVLARDLQQRLLPPPRCEGDGFCIDAKNVPAVYVAGDFYDFVPMRDGRMLVALCDVAGKGMSAGLVGASTKAVLPLLAAQEPTVEAILRTLSDKLAGELAKREFVAVVLAMFEPSTGVVTLANAGMPDAVVVRGSIATTVVVPGPRYPAGVKLQVEYESASVTLTPGDRLVLFSDGLAEATVNGAPVGYERVTAAIAKHASLDALFAALEPKGEREDDWTAVSIERTVKSAS